MLSILAGIFMLWSPSSLGQASTVLSNAHPFPVPFVPSKGDSNITFSDITASVTIRIYTSNGILVQSLQENDSDGRYVWDTRSSDGDSLASGVYIYVISSAVAEKKGKLVITR